MKKLIPFLSAAAILMLLIAAATTIDDFFLPGSQIGQSGNLETPDRCDNCHGGYDQAIEPAFNWRGSMMAQAARDPIFYACLAIANQDAPGVGDMCLRCHTPDGWLNGRCVPTDGSALNSNDRQGVQCDFCHKMVTPDPDALLASLPTTPIDKKSLYQFNPTFNSRTYDQDKSYIAQIIPLPGTSANGMYLADANNSKRGPFADATGRHQMFYSPFHQEAALCGTCHDVSNPALTRASIDIPTYSLNEPGKMSETFNLRLMFPIERTYSEYLASAYNKPKEQGGMTCQDCHMKDVTGKAASMKDAKFRTDMPLHDMTGGNTFAPKMIKQKWAAEVNAAALDAGITRAQAQLKAATELTLVVDALNKTASVKVVNKTGHKFPTGYPEGRRAWINLIAYDASGTIIFESGTYNSTLAEITDPGQTAKIYHCEPGISPGLAAALGSPYAAGPSYHMALNDMIYYDNRIPPSGATNASLEFAQSPSVGYTYNDLQNWDITNFTFPSTPSRVEAKLFYQTASKSFVTFLRDKNTTNSAGTELYALWEAHGKSAPELINSATWGSGGTPVKYVTAAFSTTVTRKISTKTGTSATTTVQVTPKESGATVNVSYTGPTSGTLAVSTNSAGQAVLTTKAIKNPIGTWCFTITNVTKTGYTYELPKPLTRICEGDIVPAAIKSAVLPQLLSENSLMVYPNPVIGKARIAYSVEEECQVRIAVYNNLGQQISLLVDKKVGAGDYVTEWDGTGYREGVYICRMTAGNQVISKTLMLKK